MGFPVYMSSQSGHDLKAVIKARSRANDHAKTKNLPKGKSNKKEYSAHRLMVEIRRIELLTS